MRGVDALYECWINVNLLNEQAFGLDAKTIDRAYAFFLNVCRESNQRKF